MDNIAKKHGGHNAGKRSVRSSGSGPVFEIRQALVITQREMADAMGCSVQAVEAMEREGRGPKSKAHIERALGVAWRMNAGERRTEILAKLSGE